MDWGCGEEAKLQNNLASRKAVMGPAVAVMYAAPTAPVRPHTRAQVPGAAVSDHCYTVTDWVGNIDNHVKNSFLGTRTSVVSS